VTLIVGHGTSNMAILRKGVRAPGNRERDRDRETDRQRERASERERERERGRAICRQSEQRQARSKSHQVLYVRGMRRRTPPLSLIKCCMSGELRRRTPPPRDSADTGYLRMC
jgi:hypothetical protein